MKEEDLRLADALGACGADIVLSEHVEHRTACDAGDERNIDKAKRDGGQDQVLKPWPEPFGQGCIALHRQPGEL